MSCPTLVKSAVISALAGFCLVSSAQDHELTTDVVVIGGGISGLSSAMSVLDHGGKVVVLEKLPGLGGAGNYFEGAFAADSDYKRRTDSRPGLQRRRSVLQLPNQCRRSENAYQ